MRSTHGSVSGVDVESEGLVVFVGSRYYDIGPDDEQSLMLRASGGDAEAGGDTRFMASPLRGRRVRAAQFTTAGSILSRAPSSSSVKT